MGKKEEINEEQKAKRRRINKRIENFCSIRKNLNLNLISPLFKVNK